ncbi:hypothetical protein [Neobacillus niacini]|uniref:hypothetical protein n=1 Tax=Neobacillus niacini TaxID=86668 RepID=UPI001C8EAE8B|nr:hypothetical protein [Neobacillus niacini]MBY0145094.1 hypothetical protein [Neobacillus niacini]
MERKFQPASFFHTLVNRSFILYVHQQQQFLILVSPAYLATKQDKPLKTFQILPNQKIYTLIRTSLVPYMYTIK